MEIEKEFKEKIKQLENEKREKKDGSLEDVIYHEIEEYAYNNMEHFQRIADMKYKSETIMNELSEVISEINQEKKLETYEKEEIDSKLKCISSSYNDLIFENVTFDEISKRRLVDIYAFNRIGLKEIRGDYFIVKRYPKKMDYIIDAVNIKRECKEVYDFAQGSIDSFIYNIKNECVE